MNCSSWRKVTLGNPKYQFWAHFSRVRFWLQTKDCFILAWVVFFVLALASRISFWWNYSVSLFHGCPWTHTDQSPPLMLACLSPSWLLLKPTNRQSFESNWADVSRLCCFWTRFIFFSTLLCECLNERIINGLLSLYKIPLLNLILILSLRVAALNS